MPARIACHPDGELEVEVSSAVDPHTPTLEAVLGIPVETLTAVPAIAARLKERLPEDAIVVAPAFAAGPPS